jgi:PAS domain S-box-containing protein
MDGSSLPSRHNDLDRATEQDQVDRVLLVDDDPVARLLTASALIERGWTVIEADGGSAGLALFERHQPDVVVLDALMPEIDGFTTCERLRRLGGGAHVPVLMLTGLDDDGSIARAYEAGATDFFVKTSSQWTLLSERLRYLLRAARTREELAASQAKLKNAQRIARLGSWEWNIARRWVKLSPECYQIVGLAQQDDGLADWFLWTRVLEEDRARIQLAWRDAVGGGGPLAFECRIARPNGQVRTVHIEAEIDRDDHGAAASAHGVLQDVTERKQAEDQIRRLANYDPLTGLPNRRYFRDQLHAALQSASVHCTRAAVLFIDVDRFKQVNDTMGHQLGDQLLREVSKRLFKAVKSGATEEEEEDPNGSPTRPGPVPFLASPLRGLAAGAHSAGMPYTVNSVARLGGDEFVILLTNVADERAVERASLRLLDAVRLPIVCGGNEIFVTASIGVSMFPQHGADADSLVRKADIAMYAVKEAGRNGWRLFDDAMNTVTAQRWRVENALHRALERKELVLHYQPKVNVVNGEVVGAEALLRWQRDTQLVPPAEFIGAAEETGLIVPITEWLIGEVCRQQLAWTKVGIRLPVSINISSRHVQRASLIQPIEAALQASGADPQMLELELTETALMHNLEGAAPLFAALKRLGVRISIDDFGTGYSSLSYLKRLPIDTLKIDRSFVRDLESSADNAAIVGAIIAMSKSLKLRVVAEGVETRGQMTRLFEQGCQVMQGFLFAPALPPPEFVQMMAQSHGSTDWRVQFGAPQVSTPAAPAAPVAVTHSHSNGTHFGTLDPRAAPAQRSAPVTAIPLRGSAAPLPVSSSAPNSASLSAPSGGPIAATPATPARPTDDALGDAQAPVDEERASEPHHARALRWARRFVTRD